MGDEPQDSYVGDGGTAMWAHPLWRGWLCGDNPGYSYVGDEPQDSYVGSPPMWGDTRGTAMWVMGGQLCG